MQSQKLPAQKEIVDVVGPVCESGDFFARDRELSRVEEGDLLAILDAGAYGMVLASNYNTRPRPAEVLVSGKSVKLIRRREKVRELYSAESVGTAPIPADGLISLPTSVSCAAHGRNPPPYETN